MATQKTSLTKQEVFLKLMADKKPKGGTSRSDNAPLASRACAGAKLACGATLSATREFAWLAWVVNLLVVAVMITTREPLAPIVATHFISRHNYPTNVCYSP